EYLFNRCSCSGSWCPKQQLSHRGLKRRSILKDLSSCHYFLSLFVKGHKLTRSQCCGSHDVCNRMVVSRHDIGVGLRPASDTFHPVSHVERGHRICPSIGACCCFGHF